MITLGLFHSTATGHKIKWDHFEVLTSGKTDYHCIGDKETLFIPSNISSEKVMLYLAVAFCINYC